MKICIVYSEGDISTAFPDDFKGREDNNHVEDVKNTLLTLGHDVYLVPADDNMFETLKDMKVENDVDLVFNLADDGYNLNTQLEPQIPAMFDLLGIPYTGSDHLCLGNCLDKLQTKKLLRANNLPTPKFKIFDVKISNKECISPFNFPLIVKPSREDGSIGIKRDSVVENTSALINKVNDIIEKYHQPALVEEFIDGRELNVGILGRDKLIVLPLSEIIFKFPSDEKKFISYRGKWHEKSIYYKGTIPECPANLNKELFNILNKMAIEAYKIMDVKDYGRIDFRVDYNDNPYILEVNPNPDISRDAGLARMARAYNMTYKDLINNILKSSLGNKEWQVPDDTKRYIFTYG